MRISMYDTWAIIYLYVYIERERDDISIYFWTRCHFRLSHVGKFSGILLSVVGGGFLVCDSVVPKRLRARE